MTVLVLSPTSAAVTTKAAPALFDQLDKALKIEGEDLVKKTKVSVAIRITETTTAESVPLT